jgi:hypothetical protein
MSDLPARIDRAAIERVIQRAAELQTGERELGDGLTAEEVVALGKEVGIPERYLQQALLEERGRAVEPVAHGLLDRMFGVGTVTAQRVVRGDVDSAERGLIAWMGQQELLTVQRQQSGRITWEPLRGVQAAIRRSGAAFSGRKVFMLTRARLVTAVVTALEPGFCLVALAADLHPVRGAIIGGVTALGAAAIATSAALAVMTPFWWVAVAPLPFFAGMGWGVARQFRPAVQRTLLGLERALDHLERGEVKPAHALPPRPAGLLGAVFDELRKL